MAKDDPPAAAALWRRRATVAVKFAVVALVLAFVSHVLRDGLRELAQRELTIAPGLALASGVAYCCGQLVMAWFWRRVLVALDQPAPTGPAIAAFYMSQLGKYVPGKASVVLIRTERLLTSVRRGAPDGEVEASAATVGASVFYETLTYMAVGSLLSAGLTAATVGTDTIQWWAVVLALGLAAACVTPTLPPVFGWLLSRVTPVAGRKALQERLRRQMSYSLAATGVGASLVGWLLMGVSVWLAAESVESTSGLGAGSMPLWVLAAALPTVAGFVSLLPGGLVVREALSLGLLAPALGDANALAVTVAARLVGVVTEVVVCASLLGGGVLRNRRRNPPNAPRDDAT